MNNTLAPHPTYKAEWAKWDVFQCVFQAKVVDNFAVKEWVEMSKLNER